MATSPRRYTEQTGIGAVIGGKMRISKQSLIGHIASPETVRKVGTWQLQKLLTGYKRAEK